MKKYSLILLVIAVSISLYGVVASPEPFTITLEDGRTMTVIQHGDEYHSYLTDLNGNLVRGHIPGAEEAQAIGMRRQQNQKMLGGHFPLTGSPRSVAILVNFQDVKFTYTRQDFHNLLNESGYSENGATGSCRDYFIASSDSLFRPQFDVYGPYTVSKNMAYYGAEEGEDHDRDPGMAFIEAAQLAVADGVDFSQYDTDGDGQIDNVFFYYAGNNQAEGASSNTIWPHASNLAWRDIRLSGKLLSSYACTSERRGPSSTVMCSIGTFCHEFGHVLGLPDFYDTSYRQYTVGSWDIMCSGNYNNNGRTPPSYSSYERFYLGWLKPVQLTEANHYYLQPLTQSNAAYLIAERQHNLEGTAPNPSEFFLLENRQRVGWDEPYGALPGTGMVVWHIDFVPSLWSSNTPNNGTPLHMHLEEAGGHGSYESAGDTYPGARGITVFTPKLHNGTLLTEQPVFNIHDEFNLVDFIYISEGTQKLVSSPDAMNFDLLIDDQRVPTNWHSEKLRLTGHDLATDEEIRVSTTAGSNFYITADARAAQKRGDGSWSNRLTLSNAIRADGTLDTVVYVCYRPTRRMCKTESTILSVQTNSAMLSVRLNGSTERPVYVHTPVIKSESRITPYSFRANWQAVDDAANYYLTVYRVEEGQSSITQDFEHFSSQEDIIAQGWESTTTATTSAFKKDGHTALIMQADNDRIVSETYPAPISTVSYWVNAMTTSADTVGWLLLEGQNEAGDWTNLSREKILKMTKSRTVTVNLNEQDGYLRFRLTYSARNNEGLALDAFTATCNKTIHYLYKGREFKVAGSDSTAEIGNLAPATRYEYRIQCTDGDKGCTEHLTPLSPTRAISTLAGDSCLSLGADTINQRLHYTAYLQNADAKHTLYIYDLDGHRICAIPLTEGQTSVELPDDKLTHGQIYILKYSITDDISRKDISRKFIYRHEKLKIGE